MGGFPGFWFDFWVGFVVPLVWFVISLSVGWVGMVLWVVGVGVVVLIWWFLVLSWWASSIGFSVFGFVSFGVCISLVACCVACVWQLLSCCLI